MPVSQQDRQMVEQVFASMHEREKGEERMMALFHEDAVLTEPFSGEPRTHTGKPAIRAWFKQAVQEMPPDLALKMDRIDMDGPAVKAEWTCTSQVFGGPMRGYDLYHVVSGKIKKADFVVTEMPPMA